MSEEPYFNNKLIHDLTAIGGTKTFAEGDFLAKEGELKKSLLVESGVIRVFYLTELRSK